MSNKYRSRSMTELRQSGGEFVSLCSILFTLGSLGNASINSDVHQLILVFGNHYTQSVCGQNHDE